MAIAKQSAGVSFGYKPKAKRVERRKPTWLQRMVGTLGANAREMREFAADEIVYETMDTIRLFKYLRYELGLAGPRRTTNDERAGYIRLPTDDDERRPATETAAGIRRTLLLPVCQGG